MDKEATTKTAGAVVLTQLEADTLKSLASQTGGVFREANVWVDLAALIEETVKEGRLAKPEVYLNPFTSRGIKSFWLRSSPDFDFIVSRISLHS